MSLVPCPYLFSLGDPAITLSPVLTPCAAVLRGDPSTEYVQDPLLWLTTPPARLETFYILLNMSPSALPHSCPISATNTIHPYPHLYFSVPHIAPLNAERTPTAFLCSFTDSSIFASTIAQSDGRIPRLEGGGPHSLNYRYVHATLDFCHH